MPPEIIDELRSLGKKMPDHRTLKCIINQLKEQRIDIPSDLMAHVTSSGYSAGFYADVVSLFLIKFNSSQHLSVSLNAVEPVIECAYQMKSPGSILQIIKAIENKSSFENVFLIAVKAVWRCILVEREETQGTSWLTNTKALLSLVFNIIGFKKIMNLSGEAVFLTAKEEESEVSMMLRKFERFCVYDTDRGECEIYWNLSEHVSQGNVNSLCNPYASCLFLRSCRENQDTSKAIVYLEKYKAHICPDDIPDDRVLTAFCQVSSNPDHTNRCVVEISHWIDKGYTLSTQSIQSIIRIALRAKESKLLLKILHMAEASELNGSESTAFEILRALAKIPYAGFHDVLKKYANDHPKSASIGSYEVATLAIWLPKCVHANLYRNLVENFIEKGKSFHQDDVILSLLEFFSRYQGLKFLEVYLKAKELGFSRMQWVILLLRWTEISLYARSDDDVKFAISEAMSQTYRTDGEKRSVKPSIHLLSSCQKTFFSKSAEYHAADLTSVYKNRFEFLKDFSLHYDSSKAEKTTPLVDSKLREKSMINVHRGMIQRNQHFKANLAHRFKLMMRNLQWLH